MSLLPGVGSNGATWNSEQIHTQGSVRSARELRTLLEAAENEGNLSDRFIKVCHAAADGQEPEMVRILQSAVRERDLVEFLQIGALEGDLKMVQLFLNCGADVNAPLDGPTVLQTAAQKGHLEVARLLLDSGADVNARPPTERDLTALQAAAREGHLEVVQFLLDSGADVNAPPAKHGFTALQAAAGKGHLEVVRLLLDSGADVNARPARDTEVTAFEIAGTRGNLEIAQLIFDCGAYINS
jgi:ankyrin repeat protein